MSSASSNMVDATPSDEGVPERTCNDSTMSLGSSQESSKESPRGPGKVSFEEEPPKTQCVSTLRSSMAELEQLEKLTSRMPYEFEWKEHFLPPWRALIGLVALMECLGYVLPLVVSSWDSYNAPAAEEAASEQKGIPLVSGLLKGIGRRFRQSAVEQAALLIQEDQQWWRAASHWLADHKFYFGFALSLLWFFDAFFLASTWRAKVAADHERDWFLSQYDINGNKKTPGPDEKTLPRDCPNDGVAAYALRLLAQWLLLPASFYILFFADMAQVLHMIDYTSQRDNSTHLVGTLNTDAQEALSNVTDIHTLHSEASMLELDDQYTTTSIKYCVLYMAVVHIVNVLKSMFQFLFKNTIDTVIKPKIKQYAVRVGRFAVLKPIVFKRRLNTVRTSLRWAKYLAPIIGTANKLRGNAKDLIKKYRQRREAIIAQRLREQIFAALTEEERMERSAIMMQKKFRSWQARKAVRAMAILEGKKEVFAALRMQNHFRAMLARARMRLQQKKARLEHLRLKERNNRDPRRAKLIRTPSKVMTDEDRRTMYLLEQELEREREKRSNRTMLLRPNTRFAVIWKVLFIICVSLEISQKILDPKLAQYKNPETGERLNFEGAMEAAFVPKPMEEWTQCYKKGIPLKMGKLKKASSKADTTLNSNTTSNGTGHKKMRKNAPWYCHEPYPSTLSIYINTLKFLVHNFLLLVSCICFLDVFVTFFTGEFSEDDGTLIPKPFFVRWILPGILLQILVNPMMGQVFLLIKITLRWIHGVGPARCWRWFTSFLFPVLGYMWHLFEWYVWRKLVKRENANTLQRS